MKAVVRMHRSTREWEVLDAVLSDGRLVLTIDNWPAPTQITVPVSEIQDLFLVPAPR